MPVKRTIPHTTGMFCNAPVEYVHSSAEFYLTGEQGFYPLTNFMEMEEVDFNRIAEINLSSNKPGLEIQHIHMLHSSG